jgi:hypothetical protein
LQDEFDKCRCGAVFFPHLTGRTDIFSLGAVLYEMATGKVAFPGKTSAVVFKAILDETPTPPTKVIPSLPLQLDQIAAKVLEKDRDLRYQSAADLRADLQRLKRDSESGRTAAASSGPLAPQAAPVAKLWKIALPVLLIALFVAGGFYYRSLQLSKRLSDKDTIVLADFANSTGDPIFDDTLKTALTVSLRQSPFLNLLSDSEIAKTLQLMTRPASTKLTPEVVRELCQRAGSKAYLAGSIASLGSEYVIALKAANCQNGETLAQELVTASSKEKALDALGEAASKLRGELGESLATVQRFDVPLEQATTSSLEALKAYSAGRTALHRQGDLAAIPFYQRAVELDPSFAMAYDALASAYGNISKPEIADTYSRKAFELRDRTSEWERFRLSADYYISGAGQLGKAAEVAELWAQTYPNEAAPNGVLASIYNWLGESDKALTHATIASRKEHDNANGLAVLLEAYMALNRFSDAEAVAGKMRILAPDVPHYSIYFLGFVRGDVSEMQRQMELAKEGKGDVELLASAAADTDAYHGHIEKQPGAQVISRDRDNEPVAISQTKRALWEAEFQLTDAARKDARQALANAPTLYVRVLASLALARAGDSARAEKLITEMEGALPPDSMMILYGGSSIRASLDLNRNDAADAIKRLQAAANVELSTEWFFPGSTMYPVYLRGLAYLASHRGQEAAVEFQKFVDHRGLIANCALGALAHLQLGRAYVIARNTTKAKAADQAFLTLWKDADPGIPILKEAKAEYAKLQ